MYQQLQVLNLVAEAQIKPGNGNVFILKTCQRTLLFGFNQDPFELVIEQKEITNFIVGTPAYEFLLETICGLKSEVIAEYEVVNQFKTAYKSFMSHPLKNTKVIQIIEKLFRDSKKIRTEHLNEIGQMSYAGIARKMVYKRHGNCDVLVIGSGSLAQDLIKLLKKKHQIYISARNQEKCDLLTSENKLHNISWLDFDKYKNFQAIINTVGTKEIIFTDDFFKKWVNATETKKLFIDLGSPSVIQTHLKIDHGVVRLEDVYRQSAKLSNEKNEKIQKARDAIKSICYLNDKSENQITLLDWKEINFAY